MSVWKKWCLEKGIVKEIEHYGPTQLNTLLERFYAEIKNKHQNNKTSEKTIPFHRKGYGHRLNNSLNCLTGLWTLCTLKMWKYHCILLFWSYAVVLTERTVWFILALDARVLLLLNYDKLSRICSSILLISNHIIFLVQFGLNKHLLIFSKITNCTRLTGSCNFVSIWKMYSCLFIPNCTRNHVITSTNMQMFMK